MIAPRIPVEFARARFVGERVISTRSINDVGTSAPLEAVVAGAAVDLVVSKTPIQVVVGLVPTEHIIAGATR